LLLCICLIPLTEQVNTWIQDTKNTQQEQDCHTFLHGRCEADR
jgi:hypothetical protein